MPSFVSPSERIPGVRQLVALQPQGGLAALTSRILLCGGRLTAIGTAGDLVPVRARNRSDVQAVAGTGSQLDLMARAAFAVGDLARRDSPIGSVPEIWVMPMAPVSGGAASTQTLTFVGTTTAAGTMTIYAAGKVTSVVVPVGSDATAIAALADTALSAIESDLPFTAAPALGVVTLTAREQGAVFEELVLYVDLGDITGMAVTIARGTNGTGALSFSAALTAALATDWDCIVVPQDDTTTRDLLEPHVELAWSYTEQKYAILVVATGSTLISAETYAAAVDDWRVVVACAEKTAGGSSPYDFAQSSRAFSFEVAADVAARLFSQRKPNRNYNLATLAVHGRPRTGITNSEINDAINAGITVVMAPERGSALGIIVDPISCALTDQTSAATGAPDTQWQPIEIAKTVAFVLRQVQLRLELLAQLPADEPTRLLGKAAALGVLDAAQTDGLLTFAGNAAVTAEYELVGAATHLVLTLDYAVLVGLDIVAVSHNVSRAV